jgi:antigen flippase
MIPITLRGSGELVVSRCTCAGGALPSARQMPSTTVLPSLEATQVAGEHKESYGQILKSSVLIGGSQVISIAIRIIRTKAVAILLGPSGFGLFGLYGSIDDLTCSIAGMGINSSGVRQIAEAASSDDQQRIAKTAAVLRRTSFVLGLLGATVLLVFARPIAGLTFGTTERVAGVSLLSLSVLCRLVSGGQSALIQGMRRMSDLAKMNVLAALSGTLITIPLVYLFRAKGVVPSLVAISAMMIFTSWWYSRKTSIPARSVTLSQVHQEASSLLKLGSVFMASSMMMMGVAYVVRIIIVRKVGFEATGLYQAAWTLGGLYVGFILQAMGADFYPRLTASINNHSECNRLVNEQTIVGLLLAGPGVLATLTLAPLVIAIFYSAQFSSAVTVLQWISLGAVLQVISWPMGFIIVAKANQTVFFLAELAWTVVAITLALACIPTFGVNGAGIAFFGSYVFHTLLIYPIVHRLSGFQWSPMSKRIGIFFLALIALVFCGLHALPIAVSTALGVLAIILSTWYSVRVLVRLLPGDILPRSVQPLIRLFAK